MTIQHEYRVVHVIRVVWNAKFEGAFVFGFRPKKDQEQVKLGQISKFKISTQNILILSTTSGNAKKKLFKNDETRFSWFLGHCTAKNKYIALNCVRVWYVAVKHAFRLLVTFETLDFTSIYFLKLEYLLII